MFGTEFCIGITLVLIAGLINGSFATPIKFIKDWKEYNSWFIFGLWGFFLLPLITIILIAPEAIDLFFKLKSFDIGIVIVGGFVFGIGQIFLTLAFRYIGIGVSFITNVALGTAGTGFLSFYLYPERFPGYYGYFRCIAVILLLISIVIACACLVLASKFKNDRKPLDIFTGVVCAAIAGLCSIVQGLTFVYIHPKIMSLIPGGENVLSFNGNILTWVLIFTIAGIPYILYFLFKIIQESSFSSFKTPEGNKNIFLTLCMGLCFWLSLCFFARSNSFQITSTSIHQALLWAMFMIFIVISSTFWSSKIGEWKNTHKAIVLIIWISVLIFAVAIMEMSLGTQLTGKFITTFSVK